MVTLNVSGIAALLALLLQLLVLCTGIAVLVNCAFYAVVFVAFNYGRAWCVHHLPKISPVQLKAYLSRARSGATP